MCDCFISYSHKDRQTAVAIQRCLEQSHIKCWIDFRDAVAGVDYAASIVHAIKEARFFVVILSKHSVDSIHVLNEINSAVNAGATIIPFRIDEMALSDSLEYYIGRTHWLEATKPPLEEHVQHLIARIEHYRKEGVDPYKPMVNNMREERRPQRTYDCRMMSYRELLDLGYTAHSIATQLVENDYINFNGIGMENEGTAQQWEVYLQNNSETFYYLVNASNQIVGDWSIVALNNAAFTAAMSGELLEADIDMDKTEMICFPGVYNGYILTMAALPEYRTIANYNLMVNSFLTKLEEYAENGIFFRQWCMNVFGADVEAMIKQLGFRYVTKNIVLGKIYHCDFTPLPDFPIYRRHPKLIERYAHVEE